MDSVEGEWIGRPVFKDGNDSYESDQITYNLKTQKGFIRKVVTEQGEGYVIADKTKKMEGNTMMMGGGMYTTCDQHEHPHFYLKMTKAKVVPGEYIATGPAYMVVGDVRCRWLFHLVSSRLPTAFKRSDYAQFRR